jgi:hypothetical protein
MQNPHDVFGSLCCFNNEVQSETECVLIDESGMCFFRVAERVKCGATPPSLPSVFAFLSAVVVGAMNEG